MTSLKDPVATLNRIGEKTESSLERLGITTIEHLIWHLPVRYEDLSLITPIADLKSDITATIRGTITLLRTRRTFRRHMMMTELAIKDDTGTARAVWFNQGYIGKTLAVGDEIYLSGKTQPNLIDAQFINPIYEKVKEEQLHTAHIVPFYSLTQGITHKQLRFLIQTALKSIDRIDDDVPREIVTQEHFPGLADALHQVHFPKNPEALASAIKRLKFEELFWTQLGMGYAHALTEKQTAPVIEFKKKEITDFVTSLPFTLTGDQKKAAWAVLKDIAKPMPMNRLVQGDVGSGKTVVAGIAMLDTVLNGFQSVLMAPTEVLAVQHHATLRAMLPKLRIALITAQHTAIGADTVSRNTIVNGLSNGSIDIAIGTHSLIQEGVAVANLGLVVIDEQHRFGVSQRQKLTQLTQNGLSPHLLSLTATPIPRTLALTLYGDLDIATIREKPRGRKPILTKIVAEENRNKAYAFMREKIKAGQQVFILCPLIEQGDSAELKSVLQEYERLRDTIFPDLEIRYLHGKLKATDKKKILDDFKQNRFPLLVTTSVIEVGIDIPAATIMVIEGADRFGLAQLHQFRGRVGRNDQQSYCFLFTTSKSTTTAQRLQLLCDQQDGFLLAEEDLKMRGEGDVFGSRQSGIVNFKIATLHDTALIKKTRVWVNALIAKDSNLKFYRSIKHKLRPITMHRE